MLTNGRPLVAMRRLGVGWNRSKGFTLTELMITLVLFGILVALGLPSFVGWIKNTQVRTVAEVLQGGLRTAQMEALRRSTEVIFYRTNSDLTATNTSNPANIAYAASGINWAVVTVPQFGSTNVEYLQGGSLGSAAVSTVLTGPGSICFDANGRLAVNTPATLPSGTACASSTAAFNLSQGAPADRPLNVTVSAAGKVRMCDPARTLSTTAPDGC